MCGFFLFSFLFSVSKSFGHHLLLTGFEKIFSESAGLFQLMFQSEEMIIIAMKSLY